MDRTALKDQAKAELNPNFSYYLLISLPALLLTGLAAIVPFPTIREAHHGEWQILVKSRSIQSQVVI